jgi:hypothetical protein
MEQSLSVRSNMTEREALWELFTKELFVRKNESRNHSAEWQNRAELSDRMNSIRMKCNVERMARF